MVKYIVVVSILTTVLIGCGGGSSGDGSTVVAPIIIPEPIDTLTYTDSFVQLRYPADWTVNTDDPNISAQFLSPEINERGGNDNCVLNTFFQPNSDLISLTDDAMFIFNPGLQTEFLTVNGTPVSRTRGSITFFGDFTIEDMVQQIAYSNDNVHQILCLNSLESRVIIDSIVIL